MPTTRRTSMKKATAKSTPVKHTLVYKTLLRRRSNILGSAELIQQFYTNFLPEQMNQVAVRIARLDDLWEKFEGVQEEIEVLENETEVFSDQRMQFQNMYYELKAALIALLPQQRVDQSNASTVANPPSSNPILSVKLPELRIPEFRGNPEEWIEFRDLFKSVIHTNVNLSGVQKMHYLRSSLKDEAARLIASFAITSDNYVLAWKTITDRYENVNFLVKQHMSAILKIPFVRKDSAASLAELADEFNRHVGILDKLEEPESHWNSFLVERLSSLLDDKSLLEWENSCKDEEVPQYSALLEFIHKRSRTLQKCKVAGSVSTGSATKFKGKPFSSHVATEHVPKCPGCKQSHILTQCEAFMRQTPNKRLEFVKTHRLCINCLRGGHLAKDCNSGLCRTCAKKHHTLLHLPALVKSSQGEPNVVPVTTQTATAICYSVEHNTATSEKVVQSRTAHRQTASVSPGTIVSSVGSEMAPFSSSNDHFVSDELEPPATCSPLETTSLTQSNKRNENVVFLSTAVIRIQDYQGKYQLARALLDSGSQSNFISESLCQRLGLKRSRINLPISGIGQAAVTVHYQVESKLASRFGSFDHPLSCLVLPKLTVCLPSRHVDVSRWKIPPNLPLADPKFNISHGVDLIIGAELFYMLLEPHQFVLANDYPLLQKTLLGYVISGKLKAPKTEEVVCHVATDHDLNIQLERLWQIENFDVGKTLTQAEQDVEAHFCNTVSREKDGRYIVRLPLREDMVSLLEDSYTAVLRRFFALEKRFAADDRLRENYTRFMDDYEQLGHGGVFTRRGSSVFSTTPRYPPT
ncbi:uncharacterized protein LOC131429391 [Malaya genurostris]|uniref:uncharacterized protein LOC131429391 n=1 Tax=Malaya genurostris TaxID=325434 RepID=UPI0026F3AA9B|nr:uncharacterized protein LOC131429391 [Malaya genurostris]